MDSHGLTGVLTFSFEPSLLLEQFAGCQVGVKPCRSLPQNMALCMIFWVACDCGLFWSVLVPCIKSQATESIQTVTNCGQKTFRGQTAEGLT